MKMHLEVNGKAKCGARGWTRYRCAGIAMTIDPASVTCKKCLGETRRPVSAELKEDYVGKIFSSSYGYNMTINEYARVIAQRGSVITLRRLDVIVEGNNDPSGGLSRPSEAFIPESGTFRLRWVRFKEGYEGWTCSGRQSWSLWAGKPDYYNSWD